MNSLRRFIFLGLFLTVLFFLHTLVYLPVARVLEIEIPYWPVWLFLLASNFVLASMLIRKYETAGTRGFYMLNACWLGIIFLFASFVLPYELVHVLTGFDSPLVLGLVLFLALVASVTALVLGNTLKILDYTLQIEGMANSVRIVHLSDIHVGTVRGKNYLRYIVEETNKLEPDLILMTGDLFDGSVPIHEEMLLPLNELKAPCYFTTGNHEVYEGLDHVRDTIANLKMKLLENELVMWNGIQIIGVHDRQAIPRETALSDILSNLSIKKELPTILLYHTPVEWDDARRHNVDIMLSGHTHNGQLFPFNFLVRLFFKHVRGLYEKDGKYLNVLPGSGTWGPPMRLGSTNEIAVFTLKAK